MKIPSVVLCLSYKGKGDRNIEDVHDFVVRDFRCPVLRVLGASFKTSAIGLSKVD